jgi:hypothetical protein
MQMMLSTARAQRGRADYCETPVNESHATHRAASFAARAGVCALDRENASRISQRTSLLAVGPNDPGWRQPMIGGFMTTPEHVVEEIVRFMR